MLRRRGAKITFSLILIGIIMISGISGFISRGNGDADSNSNMVNNRSSASLDQREKEGMIPADGDPSGSPHPVL